ncbi:MAG: transketolase, partial [Microbacterium sp.]
AARRDERTNRVVTLIGDGELNEGSIWEAVMSAAHYRLGNLVAFVDKNDLMMDGYVDDVMQVNPVDEKFTAFGWRVVTVDGNSVDELVAAIDDLPPVDSDRPTVIIGKTIKGKGVDFMENQQAWHAGTISAETLEETYGQLDAARENERKLQSWPA